MMEWLNSRASVWDSATTDIVVEFESYNWLIISSFLLSRGPTPCKFWIPTICMSVIYYYYYYYDICACNAKYVMR